MSDTAWLHKHLICDHCRSLRQRSRTLTAGEERSLEKIAALRGECGRLRRAMRDALDQCHPGTSSHAILDQALAEDASV